MNWDAVGALAEVAGALGVILSLAYLGIQIRQYTRSQKAQTYQDLVMSLSDFNETIGTDAAASRIFLTGMVRPESLTADESGQFLFLLNASFRRYEYVFYQNRKIGLDKQVWREWGHNMCRLFWTPGAQDWWPAFRDTYNSDFCDFLENSTAIAPPKRLQSIAQNLSE